MCRLQFRTARGFRDALRLLKVRNSCRDFMTNYRSKITLYSQLKWFYGSGKKDYIAFVGFVGRKPVAYGLVKKNGPYVSGGLIPAYRNRGLGKDLFRFLTWQALEISNKNRVYLEVLAENTRAKKVYESLGYEVISKACDSEKGLVLVMKKRGI